MKSENFKFSTLTPKNNCSPPPALPVFQGPTVGFEVASPAGVSVDGFASSAGGGTPSVAGVSTAEVPGGVAVASWGNQ